MCSRLIVSVRIQSTEEQRVQAELLPGPGAHCSVLWRENLWRVCEVCLDLLGHTEDIHTRDPEDPPNGRMG